MLQNRRFLNDGINVYHLNKIQLEAKNELENKIKTGQYNLEVIDCIICGSTKSEILAYKDRYGIDSKTVICIDCGMIYTNPRMNQVSYERFYNHEYRNLYIGATSPSIDFFYKKVPNGEKIFRYLINNNLLTKSLDDTFVFEVGCGAGSNLIKFRNEGCRVKGVDLNEQYVEFGKSYKGLDLSIGSLYDTVLEEPPDIIIYNHVLEHILDINNELKKLYDILNNNGIIYIGLPGLKWLHKSYDMDLLKMIQNAHVYYFTLNSLNNIMKKNGFKLICGNEEIQCVFKKEINTSYRVKLNYKNEYGTILQYMNKVEFFRKIFPIPPYKLQRFIYRCFKKTKHILFLRTN